MMLFYRLDDAGGARGAVLPAGVEARVWRPASDGFPPPGSRSLRNAVWWAFARLGLFARPDFVEITLWRGGERLHRLIVTPRWLRFPFMAADDLQLGDLWTHPGARGQGLARAAIAIAHRRFAGRRFWYLVRSDNTADRADRIVRLSPGRHRAADVAARNPSRRPVPARD